MEPYGRVGAWSLEAAMVSWREELERREAMARQRVEGLRERIVELSQQLAAEELVLSRLAITREMMLEIVGAGVDVAEPAAGGGGSADDSEDTERGPVSSPGSPIGVIRVPLRSEGMPVSVLPEDYRDILEVLTDAGRGLRCAHVAAGLGLDAGERPTVKSLRSKLKRLRARGWLTEPTPGLYTVTGGVEVNG